MSNNAKTLRKVQRSEHSDYFCTTVVKGSYTKYALHIALRKHISNVKVLLLKQHIAEKNYVILDCKLHIIFGIKVYQV